MLPDRKYDFEKFKNVIVKYSVWNEEEFWKMI